jgi:polyisoprenoid-binding protein YceI
MHAPSLDDARGGGNRAPRARAAPQAKARTARAPGCIQHTQPDKENEMASERWEIDPAHSGIHFSVRHLVVSKVRGQFNQWKTVLEIDDSDPARSRIEVHVDAASVETHEAKRDAHLRSPDFFDVEKFPELVFKSRLVEKHGDDGYRLTGDLTIRDVTREVVLDIEVGGRVKDPWGNQRVGFAATAAIDRSAFGLTWNMALEAGGVVVGDQVSVEIEVELVRRK